MLTLRNKRLRLEFDENTGALCSLYALDPAWAILDRPELGLSFRLLVPLPERRNNPVLGEFQHLDSAEQAPDGHALTLRWENVVSMFGGKHPINVIVHVSLDDDQAVFTATIENHSEYIVEAVYCPYLGDIQRPPESPWFKTFLFSYGTAQEWPLWPSYRNQRGYFGVDYPTQYSQGSACAGAPMSPYVLLRGENQGLYVGVVTADTELVAWHTELRPGYDEAITEHVPDTDRISGQAVATRFAAIHMPYIQPGESRQLTPVALQPYAGGWQQGVDIYKQWRSTWFERPSLPDWAANPHSWQQIHINSPEGEARTPYRDLPRIGEMCARHGIKAIQLTGWTLGGQDQGNPSHSPDPHLGTFEELKQAIQEIKALGVKVVLFAKFTWADRATEWFREELHTYAVQDPYGDYYHYGGYQYQTPSQLLDINTKRLIPMCFHSEAYMRIAETEFRKTVELGADGILFDEGQHHSPALLCFNTEHEHRYGAMVYAKDRELIRRFEKIAPQGFLFVVEGGYDWEFDAYHMSYHRSASIRHLPLSRYTDPGLPLMTAITGFNDRNMVNQCLLYRYIMSHEPYNFKGWVEDYPLTLAYAKQMDALRTELRAWFWDGEFRDTAGATVNRADGTAHHPYAVYINQADGSTGLAIANYAMDESVTVHVNLENGNKLARYRLVDDPAWHTIEEGITLPSRSAVVVLE